MGEEATDGIDADGVDRAGSRTNVEAIEPPLEFERISGGRSNLTYRVTDAAGHRWALRRPPLGKRLASAHDMGREYRIISALADTPVPVAPAVGLCEDESVNGAPFYVMDWVEGPILRSIGQAESSSRTSDERRAIGERVVDTLVAIHASRSGRGRPRRAREEGGLRRAPAAPLARPVGASSTPASSRWSTRSTTGSPRGSPSRAPATLVHGDYRLDNMILTPARRGRRGRRLGAVHARRPARRRRHAARLLGRARARS